MMKCNNIAAELFCTDSLTEWNLYFMEKCNIVPYVVVGVAPVDEVISRDSVGWAKYIDNNKINNMHRYCMRLECSASSRLYKRMHNFRFKWGHELTRLAEPKYDIQLREKIEDFAISWSRNYIDIIVRPWFEGVMINYKPLEIRVAVQNGNMSWLGFRYHDKREINKASLPIIYKAIDIAKSAMEIGSYVLDFRCLSYEDTWSNPDRNSAVTMIDGRSYSDDSKSGCVYVIDVDSESELGRKL